MKTKALKLQFPPSAGLLGAYPLTIQSSHSHHVEESNLNITATYGSGMGHTIISETLVALDQRAVKKAVFNCTIYTN